VDVHRAGTDAWATYRLVEHYLQLAEGAC
jgi:hypothetical protein